MDNSIHMEMISMPQLRGAEKGLQETHEQRFWRRMQETHKASKDDRFREMLSSDHLKGLLHVLKETYKINAFYFAARTTGSRVEFINKYDDLMSCWNKDRVVL